MQKVKIKKEDHSKINDYIHKIMVALFKENRFSPVTQVS